MAKIEIMLGDLFDNNCDCYTNGLNDDGVEYDENAMTKNVFIKLVSDLFTEWEASKCENEASNDIFPLVSNNEAFSEVVVCPDWIHKERRIQNEDNFCPICGTDIRAN